jgi:hypothetical protein
LGCNGKVKKWNAEKSVALLPEFVREKIADEASILYHDLKNNKLKVVLVPAPQQRHADHMIRTAVSFNPAWYSKDIYPEKEYCGKVRKFSLAALKRLKDGKDKNFIVGNYKFTYDSLFRKYIMRMLVEGYELEGQRMCADRKVRNFVKKEKIKV